MRIKLTFALFRKEAAERFRGVGALQLIVRGVLYGGLAAAFLWFYMKFSAVYLKIGEDAEARFFELLSLSFAVLLALLTLSAATAIVRSVRLAEDMRLFAALPVPAGALLFSKLLNVYLSGLFLSAFAVPVLALSPNAAQLSSAWVALTVFALPALALALGALLAFPAHLVFRFLRGKFLLSLLCGTVLFGLGLYVYSIALGGAKELLLGGDLKYFFGENVLRGIAFAARYAYPAVLFARLLLWREVRAMLLLAAVFAAVFPLCILLARRLLKDALCQKTAGREPRLAARTAKSPVFFALLRKEFVQILRTPSYAFSYFSVAAVMPLMVYFCMSVGGSLIGRLLGTDCSFELALFLTLLYGALANVFCTTNVSREGKLFFVLKALPLRAGQIFAAKIALNMIVISFSLFASSLALSAAKFLTIPAALFVFALGWLFSLAQVCFATRYDLSHPRFSSETDGETGESDAASLLWLALALIVGGGLLALRLFKTLRLESVSVLQTALLGGGFCLLAVIFSVPYLFLRLGKRYEAFSGGAV